MRKAAWLLVLTSIALWVVAMIPGTANAGCGSRLEFGPSYFSAGDSVTGKVAAWDCGVPGTADGDGTAADGPYSAYLVPTFDFKERPGLPQGAIELGPANVVTGGNGRIVVSVSFRVPEVRPGVWYVRVCNTGCVAMPGDLYDSGLTIASNEMEERWMQRFDELERSMSKTVPAERFRETQAEVAAIAKEMDGLGATVGGTQEQVAGIERNTFESVPWLTWLTAFVGASAIVFAIATMRLRRLLKRLLADPIVALHAEVAAEVPASESSAPAGAR